MSPSPTIAANTAVGDRRSVCVSEFAAAAERHLAEDRVDTAREICLHGVTEAPWYAPGHIVMAKICLECGDHQAAEESLRRAIEIDPMNSVAYTLLGQALLLQGNHDEAAEALDTALFLCPSNHLAAELLRRAKGEEPAEPSPLQRRADAAGRTQPASDEEEAAALRAMSGVDGVLIAAHYGLASAGTMGQSNENDEDLAASAATAIQSWKLSKALSALGAPRWAAVIAERGQLVVADAGRKLVVTRVARRLRLGRVIPRVEMACRNLSP